MRAVVLEQLAAERCADDLDVLARLLERLSPRLAVPALDDLRPGRAEPEQEAAARQRSSVAAVIAVFDGVRPGICMIAEPSLIVVVDRAEPARGRSRSRVPQASAAHAES